MTSSVEFLAKPYSLDQINSKVKEVLGFAGCWWALVSLTATGLTDIADDRMCSTIRSGECAERVSNRGLRRWARVPVRRYLPEVGAFRRLWPYSRLKHSWQLWPKCWRQTTREALFTTELWSTGLPPSSELLRAATLVANGGGIAGSAVGDEIQRQPLCRPRRMMTFAEMLDAGRAGPNGPLQCAAHDGAGPVSTASAEKGRLVAMAGERLKPEGHTEVSAVCTHPDYPRSRFTARRSSPTSARALSRRPASGPFPHVIARITPLRL